VDRLGEQRPGQPGVLEGPPRERPEHRLEPVNRAGPRLIRSGPHRPLLAPAHLDEQLLLGWEVAVQRGRGDAGPLGDRHDGCRAISPGLDQLAGGAEQPLSRREARDRGHAGSARSTIAAASTPAGSVPYTRPPSPASRAAQKASATAGGAKRTSSEAWSATARSSTTRRAENCGSEDSNTATPRSRMRSRCASSRASAPAASEHSSRKAGNSSGSRTIARSTSSAATFPEPSQIEFSGASRYKSGSDDSTNPFPPRHSSASAAWGAAR